MSAERSKLADNRIEARAPLASGAQSDKANQAQRHARLLYALAALLSLVGLADAVYLTVHHLTGQGVQCGVSASCDEVLASPYATVSGLPIAAFGAIAYFAAFSFATLTIFDYKWVRTALTFLVAFMFVVTLWLLFIQAFVLRAFCDYCLLSAATVLLLGASVTAARLSER